MLCSVIKDISINENVYIMSYLVGESVIYDICKYF
jgi:hypothetical protein